MTAPVTRRNFLQGVLGGVTATGLIVTASPADVAAFITPPHVPLPQPPAQPAPVGLGETLYNAQGLAVAVVWHIGFHHLPIDVTAFGDANRVYVQGQGLIDIYAQGIVHGSNLRA